MLLQTERKNPVDFRVSIDAEFLFLDKGYPVSLVDIERTNRENLLKTKFGCDNRQILTEVRPTPSIEPIEVINDAIRTIRRKVKSNPNLLNYNWKAGSIVSGEPLGFHCHYGISNKLINPQTATEILSNYAGSLSLLVEDKQQGYNRRNTKLGDWQAYLYGAKMDFRVKSSAHFEYRTMSSCIFSPYISLSFLCLSKVIMYEILNNSSFSPNVSFHNDVFQLMQTHIVKEKFNEIWSQISKMKLYPKYKRYIDIIKFLIDNGRNWFPKSTMKEAWGLVDKETKVKKEIKPKLEKPDETKVDLSSWEPVPYHYKPINWND